MEEKYQTKKIIYVITKANWGGAQKYVYDLATNIDKGKFNVKVVSGPEGRLSEKLNESKIETICIPHLQRDLSIFKEISSFFKLYKIFKAEKPDIVHLNSPKVLGLGALAAKLAKVDKIISTVHGWPFNEDLSSFKIFIRKFLSYISILLSDKTIVLSKREYDQVKNWPNVEEKLKIQHLGIKERDFLSKEDAKKYLININKELEEHIGKKWIGNIAELHKNKGLQYAINAMEGVQKAIYIVIGDGELYEQLKNHIKEKNLEQKVYLLGHIDDASRYIKAFDFILLPSIKEGLPYTLLEAGLAEVCVIASNVGGIPELIKQQDTGILVHKKLPRDIRIAVNHLIDCPLEMEDFGKRLKDKVLEDFSFDRMVEETTKLYL